MHENFTTNSKLEYNQSINKTKCEQNAACLPTWQEAT